MSTPLDDLIAQATPMPWRAGVFAGGHQGSVISETTGATVALTYDPKDAPLVAHASKMLQPLVEALHDALMQFEHNGDEAPEDKVVLDRMAAVLREAKYPEVKS